MYFVPKRRYNSISIAHIKENIKQNNVENAKNTKKTKKYEPYDKRNVQKVNK